MPTVQAYDGLEDLLWNDVLLKQSFTALGAARFLQDITAIQNVVDSSCHTYGRAGADMEMDKLKEGVTLLNLPVTDEVCYFRSDSSLPRVKKALNVRVYCTC